MVFLRLLLVTLVMSTLSLAGCLDAGPAAEEPVEPETIPTNTEPPQPVSPVQIFERYEERPVGTERAMRLLYGPFTIPPGQDNNRITIDVPVHDGFLTTVAPTLYDVETGATPSNQEVHIHHAHWFRASDDPSDEYYTANLAWVFGTGEERTKGGFNARSDVDPEGPRYGIYIGSAEPQALIYMLHNKLDQAINLYVALDVDFVYGSADEIQAADGCPALIDGEVCRAGETFHNVNGKLWGTTFDVPRQPVIEGGDGWYVHPIDIPEDWSSRRATDDLGRYFVAPADGTLVGTAGHLHPNGKEVIIANLGPADSGCEADIDGDGLPGTTLLRSQKIEQVPEAFPGSEEYQMGVTKDGFRAPIRAGDRITQFAVYANDEHATYEAMSFAGLYVDRQQPPEPREGGCTVENTGPYLLEGDPIGGDPTEGVWNREWTYEAPDHCGVDIGWPACERELAELPTGVEQVTDTVHIAGFLYVPGDQSLSGDMGAPLRVTKGDTIRFVNEDVGAGIRHTVTSCKFPCNGKYVANYPHPDGDFDSGKMGNLDPIDGGGVQTGGDPLGFSLADDTSPVWDLDTSELEPGLYSYYCRIHPWMRGWIEVV